MRLSEQALTRNLPPRLLPSHSAAIRLPVPARFYISLIFIYASLCLGLPNARADDAANAASAGTAEPSLIATASAARDLALNANAPKFAAKAWKQAEKSWLSTLDLRDRGKADAADEMAARSTALFSEAELQAIQAVLLKDARTAIDAALNNKAQRYAPRSYDRARALLTEAENALANDRQNSLAATALADQAIATAQQASRITAVARSKPDSEDLQLQWENYLARLQNAAGVSASVATDPAIAVTELEEELERLSQSERQLRFDLADSQAFSAALEEEIRELDEQLGGASSERRQLVMRLEMQARAREQFAQAEAVFGPDEAIVFRQSNDIVVRVIGLQFASGSPNLDKGNENLLKKIEAVIAIYPRSMLVIEGHTDATGSDSINKRLSEQRAQTVANHVISNMLISADRIIAVGYGADRPIANNETEAGRAKNRRIDLLITPDNGMAF